MAESLEQIRRALAGQYDVEREIGQGGMATVYLADDRKHHRKVAIKVLRPELAAAVGPERFLREIEIAAALTHPHILAVYDSGNADGILYYVMPFVPGGSLRTKLLREGELPIVEAVRILRDIADALAHAHAQGLVHRDVKPDNVLLSGRHALVADFGVAKAMSSAPSGGITLEGMALGTPGYMSPEQATADPHADHRSDVYAFGVLAYEMLTGLPLFAGRSPQATLSAHVSEKPEPISRFRPSVPPVLDGIVMRCLEKRPADRPQHLEEVVPMLEGLLTPGSGTTPAPALQTGRAKPTRSIAVAIGAIGAIGALALAWKIFLAPVDSVTIGRTSQLTHEPGVELDPALSPDGKMIAYAAGVLGRTRIIVRQLAGGRLVELSDSVSRARWPRWSPDGSQIAYQTEGRIVVVPAFGGPARVVAEKGRADDQTRELEPNSATWSPDGTQIAYAVRDTMYARVLGGERRLITVFQGATPHSLTWSPNGRYIAFVAENWFYVHGTNTFANIAPSSIWIVPATGGTAIPVTDSTTLNMSPAWLFDSRQLLYVSNRDGARDIYVQKLDRSARPSGAPRRLTTGVGVHTLTVSADGKRLAYSAHTKSANIVSIPIVAGRVATTADATPVTQGSQSIEGIGISRDGKWLAFDSDRSGNQDIYRMPLGGGEPEQLTTERGDDFIPSWSPNGKEIAYYSWGTGNRDLWVMNADGSSKKRLTSQRGHEFYPDWSPDGNSIVFLLNNGSTVSSTSRLGRVSRKPNGEWGEIHLLGKGLASYPRWSPDGRFISYGRRSTGIEIVRADNGDARLLVTLDPDVEHSEEGAFTEWSPDSRRLFYKTVLQSGISLIWAIPVSGGKPTLVARLDDPARPSLRYEFDVTATHLYTTLGKHESDVWVIELDGASR